MTDEDQRITIIRERLGAGWTRDELLLLQEDEIERLRAALAALIADIEEYERINNLAPNPGKRDCWQSVTAAKAALGGVQVSPQEGA